MCCSVCCVLRIMCSTYILWYSASYVSSHHGQSLLQREVVSTLHCSTPEAAPPGQLWLLQQSACQVTQTFNSCFRNTIIYSYYSAKVEPFLTSNSAIKLGSHHCSPCLTSGNGQPSQTQLSCPATCTFSRHGPVPQCPQRLAAGPACAEEARSGVTSSTCIPH